ncbi:MAG: hypothetical protein ACI9R3_006506 [Verrucomicrobiales bacterium]|jgi:hypothetical protein
MKRVGKAVIVVGASVLFLPAFAFAGQTINDIPVPQGYERIESKADSFSHFVQSLALSDDKVIHTWEGKAINQGFDVLAVAQLPLLFKQDLEQCADWAMRLWAEHHKASDRLQQLTLYNYDGSKKPFRKSGESYEKFLRLRMAYSNSHSLKKGTSKIEASELLPGDLIVQNETGEIGHVSVILDTATLPGKPPVYLIGFSFMPAREFHVERAASGYGASGWFTLDGFRKFLSQRLALGEPVLRRFTP